MADVRISDLTGQTPTSTDVFPFSTSGVTPSTYKASLAQIKTGLAISWTDISGKPVIPTATSQLTNDSGYITSASIPSTNQLVKAWVMFDGRKDVNGNISTANTDRYILKQYNVSKVTRQSTGKFFVTFTTNLPSAYYAVSGSAAKINSTDDGNSNIQAMGISSGDSLAPQANGFYLRTVNTSNFSVIDVLTAIMVVGG